MGLKFDAWKARRRAARIRRLENEAECWRSEATRLSMLAYSLDAMAEPLRWGQLQNAANWAKYHEREVRLKARRLEAAE